MSWLSEYLVPFAAAGIVAFLSAIALRKLALRTGIVDAPETDLERKIHTRPTPLLGGGAIVCAFFLIVTVYAAFSDRLLGGYLLPKHLIGMGIGSLLLMIGGYLDDRYRLSALRQIVWPVLAAGVVIAAGIGVSYVQNPFGGSIRLDQWAITLFTAADTPYRLVILADLFGFVWLLGMMYTTKFLDGLDGLVSGVTTIGAFVLFFLSLSRDVAQPETALLAIILAGATTGFLLLNFHPAKIFLGEGGSLWAGFILGTLSILSGAKIATALLIFGIPMLDVLWVILRRIFQRKSITHADRQHLHFRLLDIGLSHRQVVLTLYGCTAAFGAAALFFHGKAKVAVLLALVMVMLLLGGAVVRMSKKKRASQATPFP